MRSRLTFFAAGIAILLGSGQTTRSLPRRALSFAERVAYQYAIEEVYWRHRIWPKENRSPKPSLDEVMSRGQIEKKVEDYLRRSQALEDYWQRPITSEQLQAEIDRITQHTRQPDVLRELFAALNNDPFVIAECLARPILAERLVNELTVVGDVSPAPTNSFAAGTAAPTGKNEAHYTLPEISVPVDCANDTWTPTSTINAPASREYHTAVWTGSEMIVWGGYHSVGLNTGGRYDPSTDTWTATSTVNAPLGRYDHTAVWTGNEMIIWGGYDNINYFNTGGRYNPATNSWTATSNSNVPSVRLGHAAVWTGSAMIVWGGSNDVDVFDTGGRYNPSTDSWTNTSTINSPTAREFHTAVWDGTEMIVWGGSDGINSFNTGGRYDPGTNSWVATNANNAPAARNGHTGVWTGGEMIVWGATSDSTGGRYNPGTDNWMATSTTNVPEGRYFHTAVWTGSEMIIWGGLFAGTRLNTGGRYNPSTDSWTTTTSVSAPTARDVHTAVWTGSEMIVWGGLLSYPPPVLTNTGARYCAAPQTPLVLQGATSRKTHGGAGTFDVNLPLTGTPGIECRSGGATHDYIMVVTFSVNVTVTGDPQAQVTLGTGCVGSSGTCTDHVTVSGNAVTVPLTNIANAQTINVRINGVDSAGADVPVTDFTIPMSILIGDTNANATVNAADVAQTKSRLGQTVDATNFRSDVNANGSINAADTAIVKQNSGTSLPP